MHNGIGLRECRLKSLAHERDVTDPFLVGDKQGHRSLEHLDALGQFLLSTARNEGHVDTGCVDDLDRVGTPQNECGFLGPECLQRLQDLG